MRRRRLSWLLLVPTALVAGQARYARLGDFQGSVEVQLSAADPWIPAQRNLPLMESAWVRTGAGALLEIEFDDGSAWRLGPDSQGEISDYSRLSSGQHLTLLSLNRGTAYFTGQPSGKDVLMIVVPGAQMTLLQGSRIRTVAEANWSQIAVLEGQVRFSSPAAEMDIREGTTAKVEPAYPSRFSLFPEVTAAPLDRWNEDRDKLQAAPASAMQVTARYGLSDLDAAGKWLTTPELGVVWRPDVEATWRPYRNGRWQYFETLGYTWVSDDSWGWLPYHNGRWSHQDNLGWVWQPSAGTVFHPAEVYWARGSNFVGWGPLAPGEIAGSATPQAYTAGNTTWAAFGADARGIDPSGFPALTPEQLKTVSLIVAPPSPAFLVTRLDATRPVLRVGSTRILPSIPGITLGDTPPVEPAPDIMTNPVSDAPPPPVDASGPPGATPPPDGVYPVPAVMAPVIEVPVIVNPPDHPDYARRAGNAGNNVPAIPNAASTAARPSRPPVNTTAAPTTSQPVHRAPPQSAPTDTAATRPLPKPPSDPPVVRPPAGEPARPQPPKHVDPPRVDAVKTVDKKAAMAPDEREIYRRLLQDTTSPAANYEKALADLTEWSHRFPTTAFETEREYYYVHVYQVTGHGDLALNAATALVDAGVAKTYEDPQRVLQVLVAASTGIQSLAKPTAQQWSTAQKAARELLDFLPNYFEPRRKPANVNEAAWSLARGQLETAARQVLERQRTTMAALKQ